jgi:hypothetical protein
MGMKTEFLALLAASLLTALAAVGGFTRTIALKLAGHGLGRVALHLLLALRTGRYHWHIHGIMRELGHH